MELKNDVRQKAISEQRKHLGDDRIAIGNERKQSKNAELPMDEQAYTKIVEQVNEKTPYVLNAIKAFVVGGIFCVIGQLILFVYIYFFNFTEKTAGNPTVATMIFLALLLTGFGLYRKLGQFAGAGSAVPVTGFGNAVISAAIEARTEGFVIGVGGAMFKLAGAVILFGVVSAFFIALIKLLLVTIGVASW